MNKLTETNARVDVADVLRGLAVMGIIILHSIEHFNYYSFPKEVPFEWMKFTDKAIWDGLFFTFSGKAYVVFALLFGFSLVVLVTALLITFYRVKDRKFLMRFAPYGKMSLTNYMGQSIIGSMLFYHWGFEFGRYLGITYSFIFGIVFVLLQMAFCSWWLGKFKHGPFEGVWRKLTWININEKN
jgi:Predicted membrane protein